jgi:hypothetical protein
MFRILKRERIENNRRVREIRERSERHFIPEREIEHNFVRRFLSFVRLSF